MQEIICADYFFVKIGKEFHRIDTRSIDYIESQRNYSKIVFGKQYNLVNIRLTTLARKLPDELFCQINRSYIVCLRKVDRFTRDHVIIGNERLPIGVRFRDNLLSHPFVIKEPSLVNAENEVE